MSYGWILEIYIQLATSEVGSQVIEGKFMFIIIKDEMFFGDSFNENQLFCLHYCLQNAFRGVL